MTPAQKATAVTLYKEGKGPQVIATFLGVQYDEVWAFLQFEARNTPTSNTLLEPRRHNLDEPGTILGNGVGPGSFSPILQTNGVVNTTQNLLNLIAGTGISLAADAVGGVTITNTAVAPIFPNQAANTVFSGPGSGAAQPPAFRALVSNDLPNLISYAAAFPYLPNLITRKIMFNTVLGDQDMYTVPAGKRALFWGTIFNATGGAVTAFMEAKIGGVYRRVNANIAPVNGGPGLSLQPLPLFLEAGNSWSLNTATTAGAYVVGTIWEFDNTSALKSYFITTFTVGDNLVYTVPAGKTATMAYGNLASFNAGSGQFLIVNSTGGAVVYSSWNVVPSGGAVATTNRIAAPGSVANNAINGSVDQFTLAAGDFVTVNSASAAAGQIAWLNVMEY